MSNVPRSDAEVLSEIENATTLPISSKLGKALVDCFTMRPCAGDDRFAQCSLGHAQDSVVATDMYSAIVVGKLASGHSATNRKEMLCEISRAGIYDDPVRLDEVDRLVDQDGAIVPMPEVCELVRKGLSSMEVIGSMDPLALAAIGKVAAAAGAHTVELLQPKSGDTPMLGFRFAFQPAEGHINLFSSWEGDIQAQGLFKAMRDSRGRASEVEEEPEATEAVAKPKPKKKGTAEATQPTNVIVLPDPAPVPFEAGAMRERGSYKLPPYSLLSEPISSENQGGEYEQEIMAVFRAFNLPARLIGKQIGPRVTLYEVDTPAGTAVKRFGQLSDDLAMQLGVKSVRIQAPIPGKKAVGIEIPNKVARVVGLREVCARQEFEAASQMTVAIGEDIGGKPIYADLTKMPHLLIAGATNSGKSIGLASLITSLLMRNAPSELRMVLVDPKQVELSLFDDIPHLMCPVVTEVSEVPGILRALIFEMEHRYEVVKKSGQRNIVGYNEANPESKMPYVLLVIDELADLIMTTKECEDGIVRLAQKARAVGIHLVVATQRPSADIVTGLIKANIPSRMAFAVASGVDSRVILDIGGAEALLGAGDALFCPIESGGKPTRVQGAYVSEAEVAAVCRFWSDQEPPQHELVVEEGS